MADPNSEAHMSLLEAVRSVLAKDPGTGFSLIDAEGTVTYANERAAYLFLRSTPDEVIGRSLLNLYGKQWAEERMRVLEHMRETGKPVLLRHIRNGVQIQSTIRLLTSHDEQHTTYLVLTVEGEHDPADPGHFEILESEFVHLGPLGSLTKREMEVLALVGHGLTTIEIGRALHRSPRTIERHCDSIRRKLDGANRVQMAAFATRAGLRLEDSERRRV